MDYLISIIYGAIQGLTEFLPVSSSGHLVLLHYFLPLEAIDELSFDVALHLGTLLALIIYFRKDISKYIMVWFKDGEEEVKKVSLSIAVSVIPAVLVGFLAEGLIDTYLRSPLVVVTTLILVALLFFIAEKMHKDEKQLNGFNPKDGFFVGCAQALALIPGVSRSGITIIASMFKGYNRESATRISFLMSAPIIFLAGSKKTADMLAGGFALTDLWFFVSGMLSAAVIGYLAISFFLKLVRTHTLKPFAWYRIILAGLILVFFFFQ